MDRRLLVCMSMAVVVMGWAASVGSFAAQPAGVTLEQIMRDPDWIARSPERAYWADDGASIYYWRKRPNQPPGRSESDLFHQSIEGGEARALSDAERPLADTPGGHLSRDRLHKIYSRGGNLFLKHVRTGEVIQITRTTETNDSPQFLLGDTRIAFRRGGAILIRDLLTGHEDQAADVRATKDPEQRDPPKPNYLQDQQERLLSIVAQRKANEEAQRERRKAERLADPTRPPDPIYLGDDVEIRGQSLSPSGEWLAVRLAAKGAAPGKSDSMPDFITSSAYVESRTVRSLVGTGTSATERLTLIHLPSRTVHPIDVGTLPGITDDPLKEIREENEAWKKAREASATAKGEVDNAIEGEAGEGAGEEAAPVAPASSEGAAPKTPGRDKAAKPRAVSVSRLIWSDEGDRLLVQVLSHDNKDRWIGLVTLAPPSAHDAPASAGAPAGVLDAESQPGAESPSSIFAAGSSDPAPTLTVLERFTDPAWINGRFTALGFLPWSSTVYFVSEHTGFAHLYVREAGAEASRALTWGRFEVSNPEVSPDGRSIYYNANVRHPGEFEVWRVDPAGGEPEQLTDFRAMTRFSLSPEGSHLLLTQSTMERPSELFVMPAAPTAEARRLTFTVEDEFASIAQQIPKIVTIPSRETEPMYAKLYVPRGEDDSTALRPAVLFMHGAGYLQNVHRGWSQYFREHMFHHILAERGFVVLDLDYRASAGYGRDWRTAIYRHMGKAEIDDCEDAIAWLAAHHRVDPKRIGIYGGSYGGFLALMAMFTRPESFAAGAALRPVTDWAHYNHGYTSNILNTPADDPMAYERSSPIEFADGLRGALLICHGMVDDNVFVKDTIRLTQRLIELRKEKWEVALYPVEPHGFRTEEGWLDEYRRILRLFERELQPEQRSRETR